MNNSQPRNKSIGLKGSPQVRVYRTFEDWQAEQEADLRTPEERGIHVGSPVMWRHRTNQVIVTERAIVIAVDDNMLTLQVKDVETRTCSVDVSEIVNSQLGHLSLTEASRRAFLANQMETANPPGNNYTSDESQSVVTW
jgi:hypothetical protein